MNEDLFFQFASWLDRIILNDGFARARAFNFNLYEHEDAFAIQLIGAKSFDAADDDWACDATFSSGEDLFELPHSIYGSDWRAGLAETRVLIERYLERGKQADSLKAGAAVALGFVDGDLDIVYPRTDAQQLVGREPQERDA